MSDQVPVLPDNSVSLCRAQPVLMFVDGGTLCGKCGREVKEACERSWLNDKWAEAREEEE